jgi:hypothetical protein
LSEVQSREGGGEAVVDQAVVFWCPFAQGRQEEEKAQTPTAYMTARLWL